MMATGKRRDQAQIARDRLRISGLYLQGWIQADIADEVNLSQATVSRDIKALQQEWLVSALVNFDEVKAKELAKVDHLEREYWAAWRRSQEDAETEIQKAVETQGSKRLEAQTQRKGQAGDPRFLSGVQWCIEERCKVLGVYAAVKQELTGKDGGPLETRDVTYSDGQRADLIAALIDRARTRDT